MGATCALTGWTAPLGGVNQPPDANRVGEAWDVTLPDGGMALTSIAASPFFTEGVVDALTLDSYKARPASAIKTSASVPSCE